MEIKKVTVECAECKQPFEALEKSVAAREKVCNGCWANKVRSGEIPVPPGVQELI